MQTPQQAAASIRSIVASGARSEPQGLDRPSEKAADRRLSY
jgi:hypothetical protein